MTENDPKAINLTIKEIKRHRCNLAPKQIATLCGQAKAGNPQAALTGLHRILKKRGVAYAIDKR